MQRCGALNLHKGGSDMRICFPVFRNQGIDSEIYNHFGSAPHFIIIESEDRSVTEVRNSDHDHDYGTCNPLKSIRNQGVDAVVVVGIGAGALSRLNRNGIKVYQAKAKKIKESVRQLKSRKLTEFRFGNCVSQDGCTASCRHY
jgi:ArsR family transcriptional regulator